MVGSIHWSQRCIYPYHHPSTIPTFSQVCCRSSSLLVQGPTLWNIHCSSCLHKMNGCHCCCSLIAQHPGLSIHRRLASYGPFWGDTATKSAFHHGLLTHLGSLHVSREVCSSACSVPYIYWGTSGLSSTEGLPPAGQSCVPISPVTFLFFTCLLLESHGFSPEFCTYFGCL